MLEFHLKGNIWKEMAEECSKWYFPYHKNRRHSWRIFLKYDLPNRDQTELSLKERVCEQFSETFELDLDEVKSRYKELREVWLLNDWSTRNTRSLTPYTILWEKRSKPYNFSFQYSN